MARGISEGASKKNLVVFLFGDVFGHSFFFKHAIVLYNCDNPHMKEAVYIVYNVAIKTIVACTEENFSYVASRNVIRVI